MTNLVFSSKSLMDKFQENAAPAITNSEGQIENPDESENNENVASSESNATDNNKEFLLASTLPEIRKIVTNKISKDIEENVEGVLERDNLQDSKDTSACPVNTNNVAEGRVTDHDQDSISSDIIVVPSSQNMDSVPIKSKTLELLKLLNPSNLLSSHDLLLGAFYEEYKYELVHQRKLVMRVISWNLNQMKPPNLQELAGESGRDWAAFFYAGDPSSTDNDTDGLADIYSINLQETISLKSFSKSNVAIDEWINFLLSVLNAISTTPYCLVYKTGLLALTTIVLAKSCIAGDSKNGDATSGQIHDLRENTLGLGYLRWANKGCISVKFRVGGISLGVSDSHKRNNTNANSLDEKNGIQNPSEFSFTDLDDTTGKIPGVEVQILNVHLVHGENDSQIQQRWDSWAKIENKIGLDDRTVRLTFDPNGSSMKDDARVRLEKRLQEKIMKNKKLGNTNYDYSLQNELEGLSLNDDSIRTSHVPVIFSKSEQRKFEGIFSSVDLTKLTYVTEAQKAVVVCGDTNYRLAIENDILSQNSITDSVKKGLWNDILQHDQLKREMKSLRLFVGFKEAPINFAPTYKIINNSNGKWFMPDLNSGNTPAIDSTSKRYRKPVPKNNSSGNKDANIPYYIPRYDTKRLPAYTDRILYVERPFFQVIEGSYSSIPNKGSDHLPVSASFTLDAPLIDENKLHTLKTKFTEAWDSVINQLVFFKLADSVAISHSMSTKKDDVTGLTTSYLAESIPSEGGHLVFSAINGERVEITINLENIIDEPFEIVVNEQSSRGWFGTKIAVDCKPVIHSEKRAVDTPLSSSCTIQSKESGTIKLSMLISTTGLLERTFTVEIPEYSLCPAYSKYIAMTINTYDIFGTSFENLTAPQFENIQACFKFIFTQPYFDFVSCMEKLNSTKDLKSSDWDLVREISLRNFSADKYLKLNQDGVTSFESKSTGKLNLGSVTVLSVIYVWLKCQNAHFNTSSKRGKMIFSSVIKLINYLKMDADTGIVWFGWLFEDEYELHSYLDRDFDVKVNL